MIHNFIHYLHSVFRISYSRQFMERVLSFAEDVAAYPIPSLQKEIAAVFLFNEVFLSMLQEHPQSTYNSSYFPANIMLHQLYEARDIRRAVQCPIKLRDVQVTDMSSYLANMCLCTEEMSQLTNLFYQENPQIAQTVCDIE